MQQIIERKYNMTQSITIAKGQGLTQGLKAYLEKLKSEGKIEGEINISKSQWDATIHDLQGINDARLQSKAPGGSIFTGGNGTDWSKNMIVQEGTVNFSETEFNTLLKDMGVKLKTETPESLKSEETTVTTPPVTTTDSTTLTTPIVDQPPATAVQTATEPSFDAWNIKIGQGILEKAKNGETSDFSEFEDYDFVDKDTRAELKKTNDGKMTKDAYLKGLTAKVKEIFDVADTTPDGILTYEEYSTYEKSMNNKTYTQIESEIETETVPEIKLELKRSLEENLKSDLESTKNTFDLLNINNKGKSKNVIDFQEYMLSMAYLDQNKAGEIDGKVQAKEYVNKTAQLQEPTNKKTITESLQKLNTMLFGQ